MSYTKDAVQFVTTAARILVDQPNVVAVTVREQNGQIALCLKVAFSDAGKVIGQEGRTVHALRRILAAASQASGKTTTLEIEVYSPSLVGE